MRAAARDFDNRRSAMVEYQLRRRGVRDPLVLGAMGAVPREAFVPGELCHLAYEDRPLPIGHDQTISQPYIVAYMIEALRLRCDDTVLEVGTGSGYAAAVIAEIAGHVVTIERVAGLAATARSTLNRLGYSSVEVIVGDGTLGSREHAPFDAIVVTAGGPDIPESLTEQLRTGGRLVMPVGDHETRQILVRVTRREDGSLEREDLAPVRFVPLIGAEGWRRDVDAVAPGPTRREDS